MQRRPTDQLASWQFGLYKIFVEIEAVVQESILLFANTPPSWGPPPPPIAHTIAQYRISLRPSFIAIYAIQYWQWQYRVKGKLAFTRYSFTSRLLCTNQSSFYSPPLAALPTLLTYYWTTIAQYTTLPRLPRCVPYTIQYWQGQYRVMIKVQRGPADHVASWPLQDIGITNIL